MTSIEIQRPVESECYSSPSFSSPASSPFHDVTNSGPLTVVRYYRFSVNHLLSFDSDTAASADFHRRGSDTHLLRRLPLGILDPKRLGVADIDDPCLPTVITNVRLRRERAAHHLELNGYRDQEKWRERKRETNTNTETVSAHITDRWSLTIHFCFT